MSGNKILFNREMRQLNDTCICCSKTEKKFNQPYLPSDSAAKLEHLDSTSLGSAYRFP